MAQSVIFYIIVASIGIVLNCCPGSARISGSNMGLIISYCIQPKTGFYTLQVWWLGWVRGLTAGILTWELRLGDLQFQANARALQVTRASPK